MENGGFQWALYLHLFTNLLYVSCCLLQIARVGKVLKRVNFIEKASAAKVNESQVKCCFSRVRSSFKSDSGGLLLS